MRAPLALTTTLLVTVVGACGRVGFEPFSIEAGDGTNDDTGGAGPLGDAAAGGSGASGASGGTTTADGGGGTSGAAAGSSGGSPVADGGGAPADAGAGGETDAGADAGVPPPPACRAGCTCEYYHGARYMLCAAPLTRADAVTACAESGMRVVRITSGQEQVWLRLRSLEAGFPKFHLGAGDAAMEGTWVWDDGTPFWQGLANGAPIGGEFSAWAKGEPNSFVVDENCSEVQSIQGWNDCVCDIAKPTICKAAPVSSARCGDGVVDSTLGEVCDDAGAGQYCSGDCKTFLCPAGCSCLTVSSRKLAICPTARTFRTADLECGRAGMTLVHVSGQALDNGLRAAATSSGLGAYWVGAFDIDSPGDWVWTDLTSFWTGAATGTRHAYEHFGAGSPSGAANQDCLAVLPDGTWQNQDCGLMQPYVCERL